MKIEDLAYKIAAETLSILEENFHYRIPDDHKRSIQREVVDKLNEMIQEGEGEA